MHTKTAEAADMNGAALHAHASGKAEMDNEEIIAFKARTEAQLEALLDRIRSDEQRTSQVFGKIEDLDKRLRGVETRVAWIVGAGVVLSTLAQVVLKLVMNGGN